MGSPNMSNKRKAGVLDDDVGTLHAVLKNPEKLFITLERYQKACQADWDSYIKIFEIIDSCAQPDHWPALASLLVVAMCFEAERIAYYVQRCQRQQPDGTWKLPSELVEILFKHHLCDVFDNYYPEYDCAAWKTVLF